MILLLDNNREYYSKLQKTISSTQNILDVVSMAFTNGSQQIMHATIKV